MRTNADSFQDRREYYWDVQGHGQNLLDSLKKPQSASPEQFLIDAYQASQVWQVFITRAAYDEILSVGVLNTIPDIGARSRLTNYHSAFDGIAPQLNSMSAYRETARSYISIEIQISITSNCGDIISTNAKGAVQNRLPDQCELARLRRFDPISCYFRRKCCANPLFVLAPNTQNRL